jgi:hypothetical protein
MALIPLKLDRAEVAFDAAIVVPIGPVLWPRPA